jgi:two-component system, chemotaxis family, sensor kinase CheA
MISEDLAQVFQDELRDILDSLDRGLLDLKSAPEDPALVGQVFRDLHTIKGNGGMFGFTELSSFIHGFETAFDRIRAGKAKVTPQVIRLALAARDEIPGLVSGEAGREAHRAAILHDLSAELDGATPAVSAARAASIPLAVAQPLAEGEHRLWFRLNGPAFESGVKPELLLAELETLGGHSFQADLSAVPLLDTLDPTSCAMAWTCILPPEMGEGEIEDVFMFVDANWRLTPLAAPVAAPEEVHQPDPVVVATPAAETKPAPALALVEEKSAERAAAKSAAAAATVRVPADRLDSLMDAVGELVIVEARLTELARSSRDPALIATAEQITRLAAGLRDATMTMRMVPLRTLVGRFRRLVSEVSDTLHKPVEFVVRGEETELDKTLIEKLGDPLVHLLRNALDHGIETEEERAETSKPKVATVELSAEHSGTEVLVRIRDDGRGMNPERLRAKALSLGLIAADTPMTDAQLYGLIFEPGFSTAAKVTELSGRGVGMDVVRRTVDGLRGTIEIASKLGEGTTVTLRMPLTLAIIEGLLVEVEGERYTLPMTAVQEIVALPPEKFSAERSSDFLDVRGQFVPFLRLRNALECVGTPPEEQNVVIVASGEARVGIVVDRIIGTNQVVIKQMSKLHSGVRAVSGATILADGTVALILDIGHLVALGRHKGQTAQPARSIAA